MVCEVWLYDYVLVKLNINTKLNRLSYESNHIFSLNLSEINSVISFALNVQLAETFFCCLNDNFNPHNLDTKVDIFLDNRIH